MPWAADYSRASAEEYLARSIKGWDEGTEYNYAILTGDALAGRVLAGSIGLMTRCGPGGLEIGYWVRRGVHRPRSGHGGDRGPGRGRRSACPAWTGWRSCTTS